MTTITGNTYPVRRQLAALGGHWNEAKQGWDMPDHQVAAAQQLVASAPASTPRAPRRSRFARYGSYARFSSGAEVYRNARGRCEDAPCCGCCS